MEVYSNDSERDQTETLKRFFTNNGKALVTGAVIGVAALVGWRLWVNHQQNTALEASSHYQQLTEQMKPTDTASLNALSTFVGDDKTAYGALAALNLAKTYVEKGDLNNAAKQLQLGLKASKDLNLQAVLHLRLARIQLGLKQTDEALKNLDSVQGANWQGLVADVRGDILLSKGDKPGAVAAWRQGINSNVSPALKQTMQMKLNNFS